MKRDILTPAIVIAGIVLAVLFLWAVIASGQTSKTPINNGILQSDLNAAGYKILSANMADYAGLNMTWNPVTGRFDATSGGGGGTVTSLTATTPIIVTPSPLIATGVVSLDSAKITLWDTASADRLKWDGGATGLTAATGRTSLGLVIGTNVAPATSGSSILYGNGSGGFSNVTIGTNLTFAGGTLNATAGGGGAPTTVDYLVGTADAGLSAEIVVGTSPGGELGGTWASPTIDDFVSVTGWTLLTPTIGALSNLTTNGFVKTGGGIGTLSVDTTTYLSTTGDLSPLFTTAESAGNTAFTLSTAAANTVFGNATASTAAPTFSTAPRFLKIGNLTTNGFVKTGSSDGTLSVDTATYLTSSSIDDTAYAGTWDTVTTIAPSKNAVYDKINSLTATNVGLANVTNDAQTKAAIVPNTAPSTGQLLIGNAGGTAYAPTTMGTDATIASTGALTIANNAVTLGKMATMATDSILGRKTASTGNVEVLTALPWADTGDVTRVADGTATVLAAGNAGNLNSGTLLAARMPAFTGDVTSSAGTVANTLVNIPLTTTIAGAAGARGDVLYYGASGWAKLAAGTNGNQLTTHAAGADPSWDAPGAGGSGTPGGSDTYVQFNDGGAFGGESDLVWNKTANKLTVTGGGATDSALKIGNLEFQPFALNNAWLGDNVYYDGAGFKPRVTGAAGMFYFFGSEGQFRFAASGTGGVNSTQLNSFSNLKVDYLGNFAVGGSISASFGNFAGGFLLLQPSTTSLRLVSSYSYGWSNATNDASATLDTALARNAAGVVEVNNGTAGQYRDLKVDEVDAVTGYKLNGTTINLDYSNTSVTNQTPSTSDVYLAGSNIVLPAGGFKASGQYRCLFDVVKSAGTGGIVLTVRIGTAGTTGDTSRMTFTFTAGTSVADTGTMEVIVNWRTVGGGTSAVISGLCRAQKNTVTAAGLWNTTSAAFTIVGTVSGGFDSSAATTMGVSFNGGTAFAGTITTVQSNLFQK